MSTWIDKTILFSSGFASCAAFVTGDWHMVLVFISVAIYFGLEGK